MAHAAPAFDAIAPTLRLTLGWVTFAALLGIGVLVFASRALEGVLDTLEVDVSRAFWIGVATQLAAVPVLVLSCVVLAATIVGILGIPIVAAAWILALIGLTALGVVATARLIGHGLLGQRTVVRGAGTTRPDALRALLIGLTVLVAFWIGAALVDDMPVVGVLLRAVALALTWVAATAGMGAAVLSRGGRRRPAVPRVAPRVGDLPDWQTPTPVSGVVAARRPPVPDPVD
ncbi:MAG: hypothetical protein MUF00_08950 [Gemmatimonadaceae bacterium]|nr:hypothetical protein [Gemmatimonadaceae bacterium]